ncbi:MAG: hypothetical protein JWR26_1761 [Pedosphaera sp.]|nr:hypothetical protein [Pedosphaera sp.]
MNTKHAALLERLESFQLDSPEAALPFSARLARENNWFPAHAARVIKEYKRFAFLAIVAGHPVSPSEDVDQAWHLHLTFSENYWKVFCPQILGSPLHHHPTRGNGKMNFVHRLAQMGNGWEAEQTGHRKDAGFRLVGGFEGRPDRGEINLKNLGGWTVDVQPPG